MEKQISFSEVEYGQRQRKTKREQFLKKMDEMIPWDECVAMIAPYYPKGKRGRPPREIEQMLRMLLLQTWFNLSDEGVEDAIYDSYAMKTFMGVDFASDKQVPDATTLCKFRKMMTTHHLQKGFFDIIQNLLKHANLEVVGGVIVDATIISAPNSTKNAKRNAILRCILLRRATITILVCAHTSAWIRIMGLCAALSQHQPTNPK